MSGFWDVVQPLLGNVFDVVGKAIGAAGHEEAQRVWVPGLGEVLAYPDGHYVSLQTGQTVALPPGTSAVALSKPGEYGETYSPGYQGAVVVPSPSTKGESWALRTVAVPGGIGLELAILSADGKLLSKQTVKNLMLNGRIL